MKFHEYITQSLDKKFKWGEHDCVTFAVGWGSVFLGENLLEPFGRWDDRRSAIGAIRLAGGLQYAFDNSKHLRPVELNFATDGDLVLIDNCAYVVSGEYLVGAGYTGLVFKDRSHGKKAWTYVEQQ